METTKKEVKEFKEFKEVVENLNYQKIEGMAPETGPANASWIGSYTSNDGKVKWNIFVDHANCHYALKFDQGEIAEYWVIEGWESP